MNLATFWFILIAVLWSGYFVLEGFDFGVGILLPFLGRDDTERRVLVNTIGPVWDGNEVWLLTAGGAMFAAFPLWYASLVSGFYLALPYLASTMGWIFTEMGRQPWTVFGLLTTAQSVSPGVTASSVIISLTVYTLLYAGLAAIAGWLTVRHVRGGAPEETEQPGAAAPLPVFQY